MNKRLSSLLFAALFLALCLLPGLATILAGPSDTVANEPPVAAPSLRSWDGIFNSDVLSQAADWLGQHFALRREAITLWAGLNAKLLRSSVTDSVLLGRDGWLYYAPTREDYTRSDPMSEREIWCAARTLFLLQENAESRGADFLFTLAPNKNSLYPEHMPTLTRRDVPSDARRLSARLEEMGVRYADLFAAFEAQGESLYFPTDSHWNGKGAALAADVLLGALGRNSAFFAGPFADSTHRGDLYEMLYPAGKREDPDYIYTGLSFTADSDNPDNITIRTESTAGAGQLLCYRDSFGRNLYPFLAQSFAQATFSRKNVYDPDSLGEGDTMVVELVERNLSYLLENDPPFPSPVRELGARSWLSAEDESVKLTLAKGASTGYTVLHGEFGARTPDDDSPIYAIVGGPDAGISYYEALPRPEGFTLCLPADVEGGLRLLFTVNGQWVSLPGVLQD
ncbi:MAG: hypothetical protein IKO22_05905 [Oscillospiraceae bacterium]|nr:hypothetical protein [Oscillospiraceae bacterium]